MMLGRLSAASNKVARAKPSAQQDRRELYRAASNGIEQNGTEQKIGERYGTAGAFVC